MSAVLTPTHRGLLHRVRRLARIAWLRFLIAADEEWLRDCQPDGVLTTRQLDATRLHLQQLRVELAIAEAS